MEEKIKQSRRDINKNKVIKYALKSFIENGIESSTIADIAKKAKVTERSAFRYFDSKATLVLEAALLFWKNLMDEVTLDNNDIKNNHYKGIELVHLILNQYAHSYFTSKKELIFVQEAEVYLNRCGKGELLKNKPPLSFKDSNGPLAKAIRLGIKDGSINKDLDINHLYLNTYDSLLGLLQKMAIDCFVKSYSDGNAKLRLDLFCDILTNAFRK